MCLGIFNESVACFFFFWPYNLATMVLFDFVCVAKYGNIIQAKQIFNACIPLTTTNMNLIKGRNVKVFLCKLFQ